MSSEKSLIEQLLDRWEDEKLAGRHPDLSAICAEHPELLPQLQQRIQVFERMEQALKSNLESTWRTYQEDGQKQRSPSLLSADSVVSSLVKYRIVESHARGGLGEVFIAVDERLSRRVAIKRILESGSQDPLRHQRFLREAEITGRLDHPGVVPILSIGQDESGSPIYAMKFIDGQTFSAHALELHRSFSESLSQDRRNFELHVIRPLLTRLISACNTMAYAHSRNIIHRDIKPANIMLGEYGATYVVDWGLARCLGPAVMSELCEVEPSTLSDIELVNAETVVLDGSKTDDDDEYVDRDHLTRTGAVLGTPAYMSPEQASGTQTPIGPATDIYSLGATLYFVLTGRSPLNRKEGVDWLEQLRRGDFFLPREIQPLISKTLEAVCLKAMSLKPEDRYSSPLELATDLERWLTDEPLSAVTDSVSEKLARFIRHHRAWTQAIATAITVVAIIAIVFAVLLNEQKNIANDRSTAATLAEADANRLAEQKAHLAEQESRARKIADEQSQLALSTLKSVVLNISRKLETVSGASKVRQALLTTSINGLNKVAKTLDTRTETERHLAIAHNDIGRTYLLAGNVEGTDSTAEALRHYQRAREIFAKLAELNPDDPELQRDLSVFLRIHRRCATTAGRTGKGRRGLSERPVDQ